MPSVARHSPSAPSAATSTVKPSASSPRSHGGGDLGVVLDEQQLHVRLASVAAWRWSPTHLNLALNGSRPVSGGSAVATPRLPCAGTTRRTCMTTPMTREPRPGRAADRGHRCVLRSPSPPAATTTAARRTPDDREAAGTHGTTSRDRPRRRRRLPARLDPATSSTASTTRTCRSSPGARWVYEGDVDGETERIEVTVLDERRDGDGHRRRRRARHRATVDGELIEDTYDWFAQDADGNVWYLGEETDEYEDGEVVSTEGSWEAGVDGALPGIVMPADPRVGRRLPPGVLRGRGRGPGRGPRRRRSRSTVPAASYDDVVVTEEWNPLEPDVVEEKSLRPRRRARCSRRRRSGATKRSSSSSTRPGPRAERRSAGIQAARRILAVTGAGDAP